MKKSLLASLALATACTAFAMPQSTEQAQKNHFSVGPKATAAAKSVYPKRITRAAGEMESFSFSYSEGPYTALSLQAGPDQRIYMAFELSAEDIKALAGSQVTGFTVCSPTDYNGNFNSIPEGRFFYTTDLRTEAYTQDFAMSEEPFGINTVEMNTPYTITGEEKALYFGYSVVTPKDDDMYYAVVDYVPNAANAFLIGVSDNGISMPTDFEAAGDYYGALCMAITVARDSFPKYVTFTSFPATVCLPLGEPSVLPITLNGFSATPIESVELEYAVGGNNYSSTIQFDPAMPASGSFSFMTNIEFPAFNEKFNEDVLFKLTKINGAENVADGAEVSARLAVVDEVPVHQTLYEEYTGTWCGYCPRGFAALEYIRENYPDFVVASFHSGTQGASDPMQVTNTFPSNVSGFPSAVLNRTTVVDPYDGTGMYDTPLPVVGDILALNAVPTAWSVKVEHQWESDNVLVAKAEVANMAGYENRTYKIAYLLVADGLTGRSSAWSQTNYYNTERPQFIPQLNDFCRGGVYGKSRVSGLVFNDVVVSSTGIYGVNGSIPTVLAPEEVAEHSISFDLSKISSTLIPDKTKLRVIAAVVDAGGAVLNCAKDEVNDLYDPSAVEGLIDENAPAEYYNLNGMKVAQPADGIFIRRQGGKAEKVIIK